MTRAEINQFLKKAKSEVARLRSLGWTRADFARALKNELKKAGK
jgi:hypothetical protein